jgi:hypothetical protein
VSQPGDELRSAAFGVGQQSLLAGTDLDAKAATLYLNDVNGVSSAGEDLVEHGLASDTEC